MAFEQVAKGVVRRVEKRVLGVFIDGTGLDRACRRLGKRVDMAALVRGISSGLQPLVCRYYTLIPYEDDSRQRAFLDAVQRANIRVVVKRLPPKGIDRQVSVDVELGADMVAFALGHTNFSKLSEFGSMPKEQPHPHYKATMMPRAHQGQEGEASAEVAPPAEEQPAPPEDDPKAKRVITVVCPSRDLSYPIAMVKELGIDTISADFGKFNTGDVLKSAAKWIDLSDSETIWMQS